LLMLASEGPEKKKKRVFEIMKSTLTVDKPEIVSETPHVTELEPG
jgi:hypothetical protein